MRVAIDTLGCKVNQYETQAMEQLLRERDRGGCYDRRPVEHLTVEQKWDQVGVRFAYTNTGLHCQVVAVCNGIYYLAGHFLLALTDLKPIFLWIIKKDVENLAPNLTQPLFTLQLLGLCQAWFAQVQLQCGALFSYQSI